MTHCSLNRHHLVHHKQHKKDDIVSYLLIAEKINSFLLTSLGIKSISVSLLSDLYMGKKSQKSN